ncbi:MAG: type II secretion system protein GspC [Lysobacteraceae bacterium]
MLPDRRSLRWPQLALGVAAAILLWMLARLLLLISVGPSVPVHDSGFQTQAVNRNANQGSLSQWHLFGQSSATDSLLTDAQSAPETDLQLSLRGTLNLESREDGLAIIVDDTGRQQAYRVGDALPGGAVLESITSRRVLLRRNGALEGLSLPQNDIVSTTSPAGQSPSGNSNAGRSRAGAPAPFINPNIAVRGPNLDSIRANTALNAAALAKDLQVVPVLENGRFAGVRLSAGRDSQLMARSGLRPSDIVTSVNGIPLDGPQRQVELMNSLKDARSLRLTIRRDGQEQQLWVELQ